eukprot:scaffold3369_cov124-Cylindrotheca_fusiformis.AAC.1
MVCMGYADDHAGDVYRMYNPDTGTVIATRDITWAEWHGGQEVPVSLKMFAEDMEVNLKDDQIGEDVPPPAPTHLAPHIIPDDDPAPGAGRKKVRFDVPEADHDADLPVRAPAERAPERAG